jgi:hypothetical protein
MSLLPEIRIVAETPGAFSRVAFGAEPKNEAEVQALLCIRQAILSGVFGAIAVICGWLLYLAFWVGRDVWLAALGAALFALFAERLWALILFLRSLAIARNSQQATGSAGDKPASNPESDRSGSPKLAKIFLLMWGAAGMASVDVMWDLIKVVYRPCVLSLITLMPIGVIFASVFGMNAITRSRIEAAPDVPHDRSYRFGLRVGFIAAAVPVAIVLGVYATAVAALIRFFAGVSIEFPELLSWWILLSFGLSVAAAGGSLSPWRSLLAVVVCLVFVAAVAVLDMPTTNLPSSRQGPITFVDRLAGLTGYARVRSAVDNVLRAPDVPGHDWTEAIRRAEHEKPFSSDRGRPLEHGSALGARLAFRLGCESANSTAPVCIELDEGLHSGIARSWFVMILFSVGLGLGPLVERKWRPDNYQFSRMRKIESALLGVILGAIVAGTLMLRFTS